MSSLTHHDILRLAAPLVRQGWRVDLAGTDRDARTIAFEVQRDETSGAHVAMTLQALDDDAVELLRASVPAAAVAPVAALSARCDRATLDGVLELFEQVGPAQQHHAIGRAAAALDHVLVSAAQHGAGEVGPARFALRGAELVAGSLRLAVDASTTGGTPADVFLTHRGAPPRQARETLASGAMPPARSLAARRAAAAARAAGAADEHDEEPAIDLASPARPDTRDMKLADLAALPDDLLAVSGPRWRVLRWSGDRWKGALADLGRGAARAETLEGEIGAALAALDGFLADPLGWHASYRRQRWRVFRRRLGPLVTLLGILAVMPIAWFATSRGGVELHPLLLGISPLLMVFMIALTAREIPVMEWPPRPRPLERPPRLAALPED